MNTEKSIEVKKGILDNKKESQSTATREQFTQLPAMKGGGVGGEAGDLFRFLAKNSDVEWGYITLGHTGSKEVQTTIMTSHSETATWRMNAFIDANINKARSSDATMIEITHSHPPAWARTPSGFYLDNGSPVEPIGGDREQAKYVETNYNKNVLGLVYIMVQLVTILITIPEKIYYQEK